MAPNANLLAGSSPLPLASDVHIVGLGTVSPLGPDAAAFWQALFSAPAAPRADAIAGLPDDVHTLRHAYAMGGTPLGGTPLGATDRHATEVQCFTALATAAMTEACASVVGNAAWRDVTLGLAIGTAAGDTAAAEQARLAGQIPPFARCNPYRIVDELPQHLPLPINGPVFSVSNACSAALYALAQAADLIADGSADAMLVLGVEILSRVTQAGFQRMTALDPERCRPFDAMRNGTVLGEGAAALLLVSPDLAARLQLRSHCRLSAFGASCDAHHPTAPQPQGRDIRSAVQRALAAAGLEADAIGLVVPHGTGTPLNDHIEGAMLREIFGPRAADLLLMPIKAHLGHCAGASGAFSALAAAMALASGRVPPTLHIRELDPDVGLHFSSEPALLAARHPQRALVNAYGFGGNNLSLLLEAVNHD